MVNGGGLVLPDFTQQQHKLVGRKPQAANANKWREVLSKQELRDFESYEFSHSLLKNMGYSLTYESTPRLSTLQVLHRYCHQFVHYMLNRLRHQRMEKRTIKEYKNIIHENEPSTTSIRHQCRIDPSGVVDGTDNASVFSINEFIS